MQLYNHCSIAIIGFQSIFVPFNYVYSISVSLFRVISNLIIFSGIIFYIHCAHFSLQILQHICTNFAFYIGISGINNH